MEFERVDDLIVIGRYHDEKPITSETARELVRLRKEYTNNELCKLIIVFPKLNNMDKSGRDYLSSEDAKEGILASAMVTNSVLGRAIINFFLKLNNSGKADFPSKVFNTEQEAIQWIKEINVF
ncbi:MAG: hypothetical protein R2780_05330 [Crocinitomicaceae bacterium]